MQEGDELALFLIHGSIELHFSPVLAAAALLHLDNRSDGDKINSWYLDTGATHHTTGRREFFSDLDSGMKGSI